MAYTKKNPMLNKGDAVYGEHFNNSALLAGMFSMIGQVNIPGQFESGLFNTTETPEKALFLRITLEKLTGVNNGNNIILNTGQSFTLNTKVVLSLFKSWKRFNLTGSNVDVEIGLYDENDNLIRTIGNNQELTNFNITDENIKVFVTAKSSCTISNILFEVTTRKWDNNSTVTIPQEQITGLKEWEESKNQQINNLFDMMYPVGIILEFAKDINPNTSMKGEWKQIKDRFTLASGDTYTIGSTGGSATHTLATNEMPVHTHIQNAHTHIQNAHNHTVGGDELGNMSLTAPRSYTSSNLEGIRYLATPAITVVGARLSSANTTATNQSTTATNQNTGGGQPHNNMPPYLVVGKWQRIS